MATKYQPIVRDENGENRFQANKVVKYLFDHSGIDLNFLVCARDLEDCKDDWQQFYQLIGCSVDEYLDLKIND